MREAAGIITRRVPRTRHRKKDPVGIWLNSVGAYASRHEYFAGVLKRGLDRLGGQFWAAFARGEVPKLESERA